MKISPFYAATLIATQALAFNAQAEPSHPYQSELEQVLEAMPDAGQVTGIDWFDMSANGSEEALVHMDGSWKLFAYGETGWQAVGSGEAEDAHFEPTAGRGAVLNTDDITWAYSGDGEIYLYGDLLQSLSPQEATGQEYALLKQTSEYTESEKMRLSKYTIDLNGDGSDERVFIVEGLYYAIGQSMRPYLIYDAAGEVIVDAITTELPRIFPKSDGAGSIIVDLLPAGMKVTEIN